MIPVNDTLEDAVAVVETPADLSAIRRADCAAAIWRRQPLPCFESWVNSVDPARLPRARVMLRPDSVRDAAERICEICDTPDGAERARLIDDVVALSDVFSDLMRAPYLLLRLDVIKNNACRKFHIDAITARLICTYRGTGTQYGLAPGGGEPRRIFTAPTFAPMLLRGTLWPERPRSGLLHRSPPIEGTGETRLMLVLDPVTNPEEHPDRELLH